MSGRGEKDISGAGGGGGAAARIARREAGAVRCRSRASSARRSPARSSAASRMTTRAMSARRWSGRTRRSSPGARCRRRGAASWCGCSARSCARPSRRSARWSRLEAGKIVAEGLGEVQEMIDICDFAVGLSRQLYGLTIATERPGHRDDGELASARRRRRSSPPSTSRSRSGPGTRRWRWSAATRWSGSRRRRRRSPRCASRRSSRAPSQRFGDDAPAGLLALLIGGASVGEALVDDPRVPLVSATGSTRDGPRGRRRGSRSASPAAILELGGNNAAIVCPSADLDLALRAIAFAAMGTAGQRCTTLAPPVRAREHLRPISSPRLKKRLSRRSRRRSARGGHAGRAADRRAARSRRMQTALATAKAAGGKVTGGERVAVARRRRPITCARRWSRCRRQAGIVRARDLRADPLCDEIRRRSMRRSRCTTTCRRACRPRSSPPICARPSASCRPTGSDCGIANVNIGPSGAEIGGAFGGEKETGGGRESGSDAWKAYMRRATSTINYGNALPLAQGVKFDID